MTDIPETLTVQMTEAIAKVLNDFEGGMLTKFTLQAETMDGDGDLGFHFICSHRMAMWDRYGFASYAASHYSSYMESGDGT